jgi:hypothetical protein
VNDINLKWKLIVNILITFLEGIVCFREVFDRDSFLFEVKQVKAVKGGSYFVEQGDDSINVMGLMLVGLRGNADGFNVVG